MEVFTRYEEVWNMYNSGKSLDDISAEFHTSYANSVALVQKAKEHQRLCSEHPFYIAIIEAVKELKVDERRARGCFNVFYRYNHDSDSRRKIDLGITLDDIESHKTDINHFTDEQLLKLNQLGRSKLQVLRVAQYIYNGEMIPEYLMEIDSPRDYVTGADICRLIRKHGLQDKKFYAEHDELWFFLDESICKLGSLNISTGELKELENLED